MTMMVLGRVFVIITGYKYSISKSCNCNISFCSYQNMARNHEHDYSTSLLINWISSMHNPLKYDFWSKQQIVSREAVNRKIREYGRPFTIPLNCLLQAKHSLQKYLVCLVEVTAYIPQLNQVAYSTVLSRNNLTVRLRLG